MAGSCTSQRDNVSINTVGIDILQYIPTAAMSSQCYTGMTLCQVNLLFHFCDIPFSNFYFC